MFNRAVESWLNVHFGTPRPRWRHSNDGNAATLSLMGTDGATVATVELTMPQVIAIRTLSSALCSIPLQADFEGSSYPLLLIGRRLDETTWGGTAVDCCDPDTILQEMSSGLGFTEQVLSETGSLLAIIDDNGIVKRFSHGCECLSGLKEAQVLGKNALTMFFPPGESAQMQRNLSKFFDTMDCWETDRETLTKDGPRIIRWRNRLVRSGTVDQWFLVCAGHDVTSEFEAKRLLADLARRDPLTRCLNRQGLEDEFAALPGRQPGTRRKSDAILVTLSGLVEFNDQRGDSAGDVFLSILATMLAGAVPPGAVVARPRGAEFLILLPTTTDARTAVAQNAITRAIDHLIVDHPPITYRLGLVRADRAIESLDKLLATARSIHHLQEEK